LGGAGGRGGWGGGGGVGGGGVGWVGWWGGGLGVQVSDTVVHWSGAGRGAGERRGGSRGWGCTAGAGGDWGFLAVPLSAVLLLWGLVWCYDLRDVFLFWVGGVCWGCLVGGRLGLSVRVLEEIV